MLDELHTVAAVVAELGGPTELGRLTNRTAQNVCNWKRDERMPAAAYFVVNGLLKLKNKFAPPKLFGMEAPNGNASRGNAA